MDSGALAGIIEDVTRQGIHLHSLLVVRHGNIVAEAYFYPYRPGIKHEQWSITKSVTSAAAGVAVGKGLLRIDQPILPLLSGYNIANPDPRKQAITVENLLTMTAGFAWDETSQPYGSAGNDETQMYNSPNWVQYVLDRPMAATPGTQFNYSSGTVHLLSAVIQKVTMTSTLSFAQANLFGPLGIKDVSWLEAPLKVTSGGIGLWLTPRDMAKIGYLFLRDGVWDGKRILPAGWVKASTTAHTAGEGGFGYQWRLNSFGGFQAIGWGSQMIGVLPRQDLVVVVTGGVAPGEPGAGSEESLFRRISAQAVKSDGPLLPDPVGLLRLANADACAAAAPPPAAHTGHARHCGGHFG